MKKNKSIYLSSSHIDFSKPKPEINNETTDQYYEQKSRESIDQAIAEAVGKSLEEKRFLMRRAYPFGALRKGRPYKIWNRLVLAKEAELGLKPRKHKK